MDIGMEVPQKPYDSTIPLLGIYPKECKIIYKRRERDLHTMFMAVLFTIATMWRQLRCPTTNEWIKKTWYTHTTRRQHLQENGWIMLNKISQVQKAKYCIFFLIC
jgi:hypothetical protein